jgi:biotin-(acetyl-CoA carboxylase) ligase
MSKIEGVTIATNNGEKFNGIFLGIDDEGAALIKHQGMITEIISGQLLMN